MSQLLHKLAAVSRPQTTGGRNIAVEILAYLDCEKQDVEKNRVSGIDFETGEKIEVLLTKHEDKGDKKRRDIFLMAGGAANEKIPVGGTVLFENARFMGESGGVKRYRATWTEGLVRKFKRDANEGIIRDENGKPQLAGHVSVGLARVMPVRASRTDASKKTMFVELLNPSESMKIENLAQLKKSLIDIVSQQVGQPFGLIRFASTVDHGMLTRAVAKRRDQSPEEAVEDFFTNVEVGKMMGEALKDGVPADHVIEVIPGTKMYFGSKTIENEVKIEEANAGVDDPKKHRPSMSSRYTIKTEQAEARDGGTYTRRTQGYTQSIVALADIENAEGDGLLAANIKPTVTNPKLQYRTQIQTPHIQFEGKLLEAEADDLSPDEEALAAGNRPLAAA